jgi:hypothetical protein
MKIKKAGLGGVWGQDSLGANHLAIAIYLMLSNGFSSSMRLKKLADYDETTIQAACLSEYFIRFRF